MKGVNWLAKFTNREYITRVYNETYEFISKYLTVKCNNREDVADLLQNTYLHFSMRIERKGQFHILSPKQYLLRIAKDELSEYYKAKAQTAMKFSVEDRFDVEEEADISDESFLMEECTENKLLHDELWTVIEDFDELTEKIFRLRFIFEMELAEISKETGISLTTVKNRLYRGLTTVRNKMEDFDYDEKRKSN